MIFKAPSPFGTLPQGAEKETLHKSTHYNTAEDRFVNVHQNRVDGMRKNTMSLSLLKDWIFSSAERIPKQPMLQAQPDLGSFLAPMKNETDDVKVIWFGHSTLMLNMSGKTILLDPVFSNSISPVGFMGNRFQHPVLSLKDLPPVDVIIISHDHYDHLDMETIRYFVDKPTQFFVPLGVGSHLKGWGIDEKQITELDWWQQVEIDGLHLTATPAQHYSGRGFIHNKTLWASWVLRSKKHTVFFSGDSGYAEHFKEIGERFGPFDLAFIETGQYNIRWHQVHMLPQESVQAFQDLKAKRFFPIHWGMFTLALHEWYTPAAEVLTLTQRLGIPFITPMLGELYSLNSSEDTQRWWQIHQTEQFSDQPATARNTSENASASM